VGTWKRICSGGRHGASFSRSEYVRAPRGAYAPRSWWFCSTDICRRNCGLCDARTLVSEERRASARRGVTYRRCAVSPPWSKIVERRLAKRAARAAGVSPPWCGNRTGNTEHFLPLRGCDHTSGGLSPPWERNASCVSFSAVRDICRRNCGLCDARTRFRRAAGVSPPWCNVPTMCRENRRLLGDQRSEHQERRASARRGAGIAPATLNTFCRTRMRSYHGGLTPPALGGSACGHSPYGYLPTKLRLVRCTNARFRRAAGASARRGNGVEPWMVNRNSPTGSRTHQERRVSGRRGVIA
jgi:hypothetical protein